MAVTFHGATYAGLSGDTKPSSNLSAGDLFVETNTDITYQWNGSAWDAVTVADSAISLVKMAVNSVDSDQYVNGSIDTAHIAASQITNALMADNAIDSVEIVAGAIDLAHMSDNSVDSDQYVNGSIDTAHLGNITEIDSSSTLTLDATTEIVLDSDSGYVYLKDGGVHFATLRKSSGGVLDILTPFSGGSNLIATFGTGSSGFDVQIVGTVTGQTGVSIGNSNQELRFYEGSNYVGFEAPALSADQIWILPAADASTSGDMLTSNASGTLSWTTPSAASNAFAFFIS